VKQSEAITPEMIEACIETGERLAAAVGILKSHLSRVLEICGPSAAYPGATKKQIEDARRALNDMRALQLDAWIRRHVREAGLAA
jgi:hypothetical protein